MIKGLRDFEELSQRIIAESKKTVRLLTINGKCLEALKGGDNGEGKLCDPQDRKPQ